MPLYVNTNVSSLNAQRQLINSGNQLDQAFERLSSGFRINSAADDAAGLQISNRLGSQIEGLNQGNRNANDGISVAQTAEGALQESSSILQRMRTLAIQSENGLNSAEDKAAIQKEVGVLQDELTRIAETTSFGGENLLESDKTKTFQVGANANETISFDLQSTKSSDIGSQKLDGLLVNEQTADANDGVQNATTLTVKVGADSDTYDVGTGESAQDIAKGINDLGLGVEAKAENYAVISDWQNITSDETIDLNTLAGGTTTIDVDTGTSLEDFANSINDVSGETGITAKISGDEIQLTASDGQDIKFTSASDDGTGDGIDFDIQAADSSFAKQGSAYEIDSDDDGGTNQDAAYVTGSLSLESTEAFSVTSSDTTDVSTGQSTLDSVNDINLGENGGGQSAIGVIDSAIAQIDSFRADLGAAQNRFQATVRNQANISENLSEAQSRIKDADFAAETAKLTQAQILQQASQTILAQANQRPQAALSLLG